LRNACATSAARDSTTRLGGSENSRKELDTKLQLEVSIHKLEMDEVRETSRGEVNRIQKKLDVEYRNLKALEHVHEKPKAELSTHKWSHTAKTILAALFLLAMILLLQQISTCQQPCSIAEPLRLRCYPTTRSARLRYQHRIGRYRVPHADSARLHDAWMIPSRVQDMPSSLYSLCKSVSDTKANDIDHDIGSRSSAAFFDVTILHQNPVFGLISNLLMLAFTFVGSFAYV